MYDWQWTVQVLVQFVERLGEEDTVVLEPLRERRGDEEDDERALGESELADGFDLVDEVVWFLRLLVQPEADGTWTHSSRDGSWYQNGTVDWADVAVRETGRDRTAWWGPQGRVRGMLVLGRVYLPDGEGLCGRLCLCRRLICVRARRCSHGRGRRGRALQATQRPHGPVRRAQQSAWSCGQEGHRARVNGAWCIADTAWCCGGAALCSASMRSALQGAELQAEGYLSRVIATPAAGEGKGALHPTSSHS